MVHVKVTTYYYKLRGFCQPSIVEGSDGFLYVLKIGGTHAPNLLFNEAFGAELLRHFDLPAAEWLPLELEEKFIEAHPEMWFKPGRHGRRPLGGLHFGSRLVSSRGNAGAYQIIPSSWISRVKNRTHFIGALALDIWANHCDRRQAIYTPSGKHLKATFIDNSHMFGGLTGGEITCPRRCMSFDLTVYKELQIRRTLERWRERIVALDLGDVRSLSKAIPTEWYTPDLIERTLESLRLRRQKLGSLFREVEGIISQPSSLGSREFVNSLDPLNQRDGSAS